MQTFRNRKTELSPQPIVFNDDFPLIPDKQIQWMAFRRRTGITNISNDFSSVVLGIKRFLLPVYTALIKNIPFSDQWKKETVMWCGGGEKGVRHARHHTACT